jgi:hypothetical protein
MANARPLKRAHTAEHPDPPIIYDEKETTYDAAVERLDALQ